MPSEKGGKNENDGVASLVAVLEIASGPAATCSKFLSEATRNHKKQTLVAKYIVLASEMNMVFNLWIHVVLATGSLTCVAFWLPHYSCEFPAPIHLIWAYFYQNLIQAAYQYALFSILL